MWKGNNAAFLKTCGILQNCVHNSTRKFRVFTEGRGDILEKNRVFPRDLSVVHPAQRPGSSGSKSTEMTRQEVGRRP